MRLIAHDELAFFVLAVLFLNNCHWLIRDSIIILFSANASSFSVSILNGYNLIFALLFIFILLAKCHGFIGVHVIAHIIDAYGCVALLQGLKGLNFWSWCRVLLMLHALKLFRGVLLIEKLLEHHLVVLIQGLVYVLEEKVIVWESWVGGLHEILKVLMSQWRSFFSWDWFLRVKDFWSINMWRGSSIRIL